MSTSLVNVHATDKQYELFDKTGVIATAASVEKLMGITGRTRDTINRYMNFFPEELEQQYNEPMLNASITDPKTGLKEDRLVYVRLVGQPSVLDVKPRRKGPGKLTLDNIDVHSLEVGKIYVYNTDLETLYAVYPGRDALLKDLYPSLYEATENSYKQRKQYFEKRISFRFNKDMPATTEKGHYYFLKNPAPSGYAAKAILVVDKVSGEAQYYESQKSYVFYSKRAD